MDTIPCIFKYFTLLFRHWTGLELLLGFTEDKFQIEVEAAATVPEIGIIRAIKNLSIDNSEG